MTVDASRHDQRKPSPGDRPPNETTFAQWTQLAVSGLAAPAALRAAAAETMRGRSRRWLIQAADRLERGETAAAGGDGASFVASIAAGGSGVVGSLGDYLAVRQSLAEMRRRVLASLWGGLLLIALAAAIGMAMQILLNAAVIDLLEEMEVEQPGSLVLLISVTWIALSSLLVLTVAMALLLWFRRAAGAVAESISDWIPMAGGALAAIELAEMSDAIARLLAAGHTYPDAFDLAASSTDSPRLRRWLGRASATLRQGGAVDAAVARLPVSSGVLPALVGPLGPAPNQPDQAWGIAARSAWRTAQRRSERTALILPPVFAVCAAATAWAGLSVLIAAFGTMIQSLGAGF